MPAARRSVRILHREDNLRDAEMILRQLEGSGLDCSVVRAGATDYPLKHRLQRLVPAVERDSFANIIPAYADLWFGIMKAPIEQE